MKPFFVSLACVRKVVTASVVLSLTGQTIAFAAPTAASKALTPALKSAASETRASSDTSPLLLAKSAKQAIAVVTLAEQRPVALYFLNGGTAQEIKIFNSDLSRVAVANSLIGVADELGAYTQWWQTNQTSVILARSKMRSTNLQGFFFESYVAFKAEKTLSDSDTTGFMDWLSHTITNPTINKISMTTLTISIATGTFIGRIIYGALVAGPFAGMVGAFLDPVVRPFKEKFAVWGGKGLGKPGAFFYRYLFSAAKVEKLTPAQISKMAQGLGEVDSGQQRARALVNSMGHDMSAEDFKTNVEKMQEIWNETNRSWAMHTPSGFKDGRSLLSDAVMFRPYWFSGQVIQGVVGAETFRQGIEAMVDRVIVRSGQTPADVEASVKEILKSVDERERSDQADSKSAQSKVDQAKEKFVALGATAEQAERVVTARATELSLARHAAGALAANIVHDFHYQEFNRSLPDIAQEMQKALRNSYCLDFFHREFALEVNRILTAMDFKIATLKTTIKDPNFRLKSVPKTSEAPTAATPAQTSVAKSKVAKILDPVRAHASRALGRLNALRGNAVAIERVGTLEKTGKESLDSRAADAVRARVKK